MPPASAPEGGDIAAGGDPVFRIAASFGAVFFTRAKRAEGWRGDSTESM